MSGSETPRERPKVGVGVFVTSPDHPGCVLVGIRKGSSGDGQYALPGGHLEFGESWEDCGSREVLEETGLTLKGLRYCTVVNAINEDENYHYVDLYVTGEVDTNFRVEAQNMEPNKCMGSESWEDCGSREALEETGLTLKGLCYCTVVNAINEEENYHYITLFVKGEVDTRCRKEPENMEPDKCLGWKWINWSDFPALDQLFCPLRILREQGYNPLRNDFQ